MQSKSIQLISIIVLVFTFLSCTKKTNFNKETLVFGLSDSPKTLDPRYSLDANGQRINSLIFNGLVKLDSLMNVAPDLAESWIFNNNRYEFILKANVSFSNGRPLKKEDLDYTFQFYLGDRSPFRSSLDSIESVTSDFTIYPPKVTIRVKRYSAALLQDLTTIKVLPHDMDSLGLIGTGPFILENMNSNQILLKKRDDHPYIKPKLKYVLFKIIQDDNTRFMNMIKGNIDIIQTGIPLSKVNYFKKNSHFNVFEYIGPSMSYILVNFNDPNVKKQGLRQAINLAINREEIIKYKLEGFGIPATSIMSPNNIFHNSALKPPNYNPVMAKQLFKENYDSTKELTLKSSNNQEIVDIAKVMIAQFKQAQINVKLQSYEWGTFFDDINKGNFQLALLRWVGILDPDIYRIAFHSKETPPSKRNRGRYQNTSLDLMLEDGIQIQDLTKRISHYHKIQEIIYNDLAIIPLWYNTQVAITNKRVKNYSPSLNGDFSPAMVVEKE